MSNLAEYWDRPKRPCIISGAAKGALRGLGTDRMRHEKPPQWVTEDDGRRFVEGVIYGLPITIVLWSIIAGLVYGVQVGLRYVGV